jgi:hypothetical protein
MQKTLDAADVIDNALHSDWHYLKLVSLISVLKMHPPVYQVSVISLEHEPAQAPNCTECSQMVGSVTF